MVDSSEIKVWLLLSIPLCMLLVVCLCLITVMKIMEMPLKRSESDLLSDFDLESVDAEVVAGLTCNICLEDFDDSAQMIKLKCGHCYHRLCVGQWLFSANKEKRSCPTCRAPICRRQNANTDIVLDIDGDGPSAISEPEAVAEYDTHSPIH